MGSVGAQKLRLPPLTRGTSNGHLRSRLVLPVLAVLKGVRVTLSLLEGASTRPWPTLSAMGHLYMAVPWDMVMWNEVPTGRACSSPDLRKEDTKLAVAVWAIGSMVAGSL